MTCLSILWLAWVHYDLLEYIMTCLSTLWLAWVHYDLLEHIMTHLFELFVHTMYSTSSVYGFWKLKQLVLSHTQSRFLARNRYITDITWPFIFNTDNTNKQTIIIQLQAAKGEGKGRLVLIQAAASLTPSKLDKRLGWERNDIINKFVCILCFCAIYSLHFI